MSERSAKHTLLALAVALLAGSALAKPFVCKVGELAQCNACNAAGTKCATCAVGYAPAGNGKSCVKCGSDSGVLSQYCVCSTKGNPKKCSACVDDNAIVADRKQLYVDSKGNCKECPIGCTACKGPNGKCEGGCKLGYFKKGNRCVDCSSVANCAACDEKKSGSLKCKQCKEGFTIDSSKKACLSCIAGCGKCSRSGPPTSKVTKCNTCAAGFLAVKEKGVIKECISCGVMDCATCTTVGTCGACAAGYVRNQAGQCDSCAFTGCEVCTAPGSCTVCSEGFRLPNPAVPEETGPLCVKCGAGCATCNPDGTCTECLEDYTLLDNKTCDSTTD